MADKTYQTTLLIRGDSKDAVRSVQLTRDEIEKLTGAQRSGVSATDKFSAAFGRANKSVYNATKSFSGLQGLIGALGLGKLVSETIQAADSYASLQGQLKLVTGSQEELNAVYGESLALANATGQTTESTVKLYARLARSTEEINLSQQELFKITEAINQSFVVSGASAQEAGSAILQLSQGLAAGALRGEELNSVMENSPRLARALADGLGVTIGQLREMGKEGQLSAEAVTGALLKTADTINDEFQQMPMTIGRVWQTLSNDLNDALGQVDTGQLIDGVEELRSVIADPGFKQAITDIAGGLLDFSAAASKALVTTVELTKYLAEETSVALNGLSRTDIPRINEQIVKLREMLESDSIANFGERLRFFGPDGVFEYLSDDDLRRKLAELESALEDENERLREMSAESRGAAASVDDLQEAIVGATRKSVEFAGSSDQLQDVVVTATKKSMDFAAAIKDTEAATVSATAAQDPFQEALQGTAERIDTAFADAWKGAFDSFSDFSDGIKDAFQELIGELAHMAITRPIVMQIGAAFGLGGASGAASAAGSAGSLLSGGGSLLSGASSLGSLFAGGASGALGSLGDVYTGIGNYFGAGTSIGNNALAVGRGYSYGSVGSGLANVGLNVGAGVLGGYAGGKVFGDTTGIGSTVGGLVGSIWGPVGAGVGSFLGSGAERLLGNVLGFGGNGGNHAGRADLNLATGNLNSYGVGKKFDQANVDAAQGLAQALGTFSEIIGGSSAKFGITVGNRSGIASDGRKYGSSEEFLSDSFDRILASATTLDPVLKSLIRGFDGTAEQMQLFAASVISLSQQAELNTVTQAIEDFNRVQPTMAEAYRDQTALVETLITNFDGSAYAAAELNDALVVNKTAAYEMALAIQSIGEQIGLIAEDQARYIRESVLSEEELRASRLAERNTLRNALGTLIDPQEIEETSRRILELNKQVFDSFDEDTKLLRAESFASYAESTANVTDAVLQRTLDTLERSQSVLNSEISALLQSAGQINQQAANTSLTAAQTLLQAAQIIQASVSRGQSTALVV